MNEIIIIDNEKNFELKNIFIEQKQFLNWNRSFDKDCYSIIDYIETNREKILKNYFDLNKKIKNLKFKKIRIKNYFFLRNDFFLWDMSLFEESSIYKTPELNELLKIIALREYLKEKKITSVSLNIDRYDLYLNIKSFIPKIKINYDKKIKKSYKNSKSYLYYLFFIFNFFLKRFGYKKNFKEFKNNSILICDYFTYFNRKKICEGVYESSFWSKLIPLIKEKGIYINYLHIGLDEKKCDIRKNISLNNELNKNPSNNLESHILLDSIIDISIFLNVLFFWFRNLIKYFLLKFSKRKSIIFKNLIINKIFKESFVGIWSIKNLYFYFLFQKFSKIYLRENNIILYINEFHGWEKSFVYHVKNLSKKTYGLQFAPIRDWDLRFFSILPKNQSFLYPDFIINFYYSAKFKLSPLLRFHNKIQLIISDNLRPFFFDKFYKTSKSILLIGDHDNYSTNSMLQLINNYCKLSKKFNFEYKPHPISDIKIKDFNYLKKVKVHQNNKWQKKKYAAYIVANKTSLGMELMAKKLKTAIVLDSEFLNFSAVSKSKGYFIKDINELKIFLEKKINIKKINKDNFKKISWKLLVENWSKILN